MGRTEAEQCAKADTSWVGVDGDERDCRMHGSLFVLTLCVQEELEWCVVNVTYWMCGLFG